MDVRKQMWVHNGGIAVALFSPAKAEAEVQAEFGLKKGRGPPEKDQAEVGMRSSGRGRPEKI